jgi:hypothetical protein
VSRFLGYFFVFQSVSFENHTTFSVKIQLKEKESVKKIFQNQRPDLDCAGAEAIFA